MDRPTRAQSLKILKTLTQEQREAIAVIVETAEISQDWIGGGGDNGSICVDDVQETLSTLASVIRG